MPERLPVLEIREIDGYPEFLIPRAGGGQVWVDSYTVAQDILNENYSFYITDETGGTQTFHIMLRRDFTWSIESYPDSEIDWDDTVLTEA